MPLSDFFGASTMSDADEIEIHVEAIVAELVDRGLRDPAWIANAYIERIEPDRRLPDLVNGACAAYVHHVACQQLGIVPPKGSAYSKRIPPLRAIGSFAMRSTHSVVRPMRSGRGKRSDVTPRYIRAACPGKLAETLIPQPRGNRQFRRKNSRSGRR